MTIETKYLIELDDIVGVEFTCHKCATKTLMKPEGKESTHRRACPVCNEPWLSRGAYEEKAIDAFLDALRKVKGMTNGRQFTLKLQIASPAKPEGEPKPPTIPSS